MGFFVDRIVPGFIWLFAVGAMAVGMTFFLSKTVSRMPTRASRFVVLFVLGVPLGMVYGYSKVWPLGDTKMSWTEHLIQALPGALLCAILFTFWFPLFENSNTQ
jgi:hypothetical protein